MDSRLLGYYEQELKYLREMGGEFAKEFPKIAGRLSLDEFTCADPYVERLLEGFAFLSARTRLKLDAEFPRFTQNLLQTVYPQYLCPTPSMCIVQFQPSPGDSSLATGYPVPRDTALRSLLGRGERTTVEYRTAHDVSIYPLVVEDAKYYTRELQSLDLPASLPGLPRGAAAGIRMRLKCAADVPVAGVTADALPFFLRGTPEIQARLYEQIFAHAKAVVIQPVGRPIRWREVIPVTPSSGIRRVGFDDKQALLPYTHRSFHGYRLVHEYFTFPQRFLFFELTGLLGGFKRCAETAVDVVILFDQVELNLENNVDASNFAPYCTPAINLFPKRCDRIQVKDSFSEFQVIPDRTRTTDFEVYEVTKVIGYGDGEVRERPFLPFYSARDMQDGIANAYYTTTRYPRALSQKEQREGRRSKYGGSEIFLSIVDAKSAPFALDLRQLGVEALCTNRDLPMFLPIGRGDTDFVSDKGGPLQSIRCVSGIPTSPKASHAEGTIAWRLISHLSLNYLSLVDSNNGQGAAGLRDLLSLYGDLADAHVRKQIDGVKSVETGAVIRRMPAPGPITFARGIQQTVTFDEAAFEGIGAFVLGGVLERFFAKYVGLNSFTETVIKTQERGEIMRWPARFGQRHLL